jgi:hypothetical protein
MENEMKVKEDYWMELGPLGECPIEIDATYDDGTVELDAVWLKLGNQKSNVLAMISEDEKSCLRDRIHEVHSEAKTYAIAHIQKTYRHIDCHV